MPSKHWIDRNTSALAHVKGGLSVIDNVTSYVKAGAGKPSGKERALFAAAIVFTYGVWENYVEQLAIDLCTRLSADIKPEQVPEKVKKQLEKRSAWELSISPGWRKLWSDFVREKAIGGDSEKFGMNTARAEQVKFLLSLAGAKDPFDGIPDSIAPGHLDAKRQTVTAALDELVTLRGEIVHTGKVPDTLSKYHVSSWRNYVEQLTEGVDKACRAQCKALL
ncbi:MAG TPA: HEPN domain-containing protein [Rhodanobacter sp.]|jgi:hypothetical protein|nr:HEPN domain-containing protein [Rhodanobacter sp.]